MAGLTDYSMENVLAYLTGIKPPPVQASCFLGLFTTAPTSDAGTGGTEVSGGAYARVQVAGQLTAASTISAASPNITMPTNPGWVVPGMNVFDLTNSPATNGPLGTVLTYIGTALVLTANALHAGTGSTDVLSFSAWPISTGSTGNPEPTTLPGTITNGATITFPQASLSWGTVTSFGLFDLSSAGNLLAFDFLGNFKWLPFTGTLASPSVLTAPAHGYSISDPVVVTQKFDGVLPGTGNFSGILTIGAGSFGTDTFTVGINGSSTGSGQVRKIVQQSIPANVTASFSSSQLTISLA